jgi:hypothetical protein
MSVRKYYKCTLDGEVFSSLRGVKLHLLYKHGISEPEASKFIKEFVINPHWLFADLPHKGE